VSQTRYKVADARADIADLRAHLASLVARAGNTDDALRALAGRTLALEVRTAPQPTLWQRICGWWWGE